MPTRASASAPDLSVQVEIEYVPERSAAWCALWRTIFDAIGVPFNDDTSPAPVPTDSSLRRPGGRGPDRPNEPS
jgi:hypothetical protein